MTFICEWRKKQWMPFTLTVTRLSTLSPTVLHGKLLWSGWVAKQLGEIWLDGWAQKVLTNGLVTIGIQHGLSWDLCCWTSLSMTKSRWWSMLLLDLQMTPTWGPSWQFKGRTAIQTGWGQLEEWGDRNLMRLCKGKCQVLPQAGDACQGAALGNAWGPCGQWAGWEPGPSTWQPLPSQVSLAEVVGHLGWSTCPVRSSPRQGGIVGADGCCHEPVQGYQEDRATAIGSGQWEDGREGHTPKPERLELDVGRKLPRAEWGGKPVGSLSMEVFENQWGKALNNLVGAQGWLFPEQGLGQRPRRSLPNWVILWSYELI